MSLRGAIIVVPLFKLSTVAILEYSSTDLIITARLYNKHPFL